MLDHFIKDKQNLVSSLLLLLVLEEGVK